jgi:hypothetical protein
MLGRIEEQVKYVGRSACLYRENLRDNSSAASPLDVRRAYGFP